MNWIVNTVITDRIIDKNMCNIYDKNDWIGKKWNEILIYS